MEPGPSAVQGGCPPAVRGEALTVRTGTAEDLCFLEELEASFPTDRLSRRTLARLLRSPRWRVLIADEEGQPRGAAITGHRAGAGSLRVYSLAVKAEARGRGIGLRLLGACEALARRMSLQAVHLEVRDDNPGAVRLYAGMRFSRTGTIEDYYEDGCKAVRMRKPLSGAQSRPAAG